MPEPIATSIHQHFGGLHDPRIDRCKRHQLLDILMIAICAVICGADDWSEMEAFGNAKLPWFRTFLALPHGIPSHDTFGRVFARLDPAQFEACFLRWIQALAELLPGEVVAVDGKELRRSLRRSGRQGCHLAGQCLGDRPAPGHGPAQGRLRRSNEITAIPELLKALVPEGTHRDH